MWEKASSLKTQSKTPHCKWMRVLMFTVIGSTVLSHCCAPLGNIITTVDRKENNASFVNHKYICSTL